MLYDSHPQMRPSCRIQQALRRRQQTGDFTAIAAEPYQQPVSTPCTGTETSTIALLSTTLPPYNRQDVMRRQTMQHRKTERTRTHARTYAPPAPDSRSTIMTSAEFGAAEVETQSNAQECTMVSVLLVSTVSSGSLLLLLPPPLPLLLSLPPWLTAGSEFRDAKSSTPKHSRAARMTSSEYSSATTSVMTPKMFNQVRRTVMRKNKNKETRQ